MATTLIHNGLIHDAVHCEACKADILLADGKIAAIGTDLTAPADAVVSTPTALMYSPALWTRTPISVSTATASGTRAATTTR